MSEQSDRYAEIVRLSKRVHRGNGYSADALASMEQLIGDAADMPRIASFEEAAASLRIALHVLGAGETRLRPEERLISLALAFIETSGETPHRAETRRPI